MIREQGRTYEKAILIRTPSACRAMPVGAQQYKDPEETPKDAVVKRDETVKPEGRYANMPDEAVPYRRFTKPYYDWFVREDTLAIQRRGRPAPGRRSRST